MELNLSAPIVCTAHFIKSLEEKSIPKTVINISSGAAHSTIFGWSAYSSSKAGLEQFTKTAAMEQQDTTYPVSIYAFSPGIVDTPMQESIRSVSKENFRDLDQFKSYKKEGMLLPAEKVAEALERVLEQRPKGGSSLSVESYI
nr:SDR family NAD(P)-dependent oxidoreductase [Sinobaca sp. H24]